MILPIDLALFDELVQHVVKPAHDFAEPAIAGGRQTLWCGEQEVVQRSSGTLLELA